MCLEDERLDEVNDKIKLIQKIDGLTFGTDALLLAAYIDGKYPTAIELGGGTGIISMLVSTRGKAERIDCVEVQEEFSRLISRNLALNRLDNKINSVYADAREFRPGFEYSMAFTNPPYMKTNSGKSNESLLKNIARHEVYGDISDFCRSAARFIKYGGDFYVVYRPDRLTDLICAMRETRLEPKRMTFVCADEKNSPSIVLIKAKRGGKSGMKLTRPLIIYENSTHGEYGEDMKYIMEYGSFPKEFGI